MNRIKARKAAALSKNFCHHFGTNKEKTGSSNQLTKVLID